MLEKQFVITIARGYGSGGRHIGKALAEELGVHCYDRKLLRSPLMKAELTRAFSGWRMKIRV